MPRQSISLTAPNAEWIKLQIENEEYTSTSDAINDLLRQFRRQEAQRLDNIRALLIEAEESVDQAGYNTETLDERLRVLKLKAQQRGLL